MITYKTLENTDLEKLYSAFIEAFSDYQVKIEMSRDKFNDMLIRRGYAAEHSIGAFCDGKLVGFILNGLRQWDGRATAYDVGTGVAPKFRKQGITGNMISQVRDMLKERGIHRYLLEVIKTNSEAVKVYKKQGFKASREFCCFMLEKESYKQAEDFNVTFHDKLEKAVWDRIVGFWDFSPSWQNSLDSILAAAGKFVYCTVSIEGNIVGYGIIDKKTGDIPQIAVDRSYRGKGLGRSIITAMIKSTSAEKISVLNIQQEYKEIQDFLINLGFQHYVEQYEMLLDL